MIDLLDEKTRICVLLNIIERIQRDDMKMNNEIQTECLFQDVISILRRIYIYI